MRTRFAHRLMTRFDQTSSRLRPPAERGVVAGQGVPERRQVGRVVLEVGVEGRDPVAPRRAEARGGRRRLADVRSPAGPAAARGSPRPVAARPRASRRSSRRRRPRSRTRPAAARPARAAVSGRKRRGDLVDELRQARRLVLGRARRPRAAPRPPVPASHSPIGRPAGHAGATDPAASTTSRMASLPSPGAATPGPSWPRSAIVHTTPSCLSQSEASTENVHRPGVDPAARVRSVLDRSRARC